MESLKEILTHPIATASGIIAAATALFPIPLLDPIVAQVWAQSGTLFSAVSLTAWTFAPRVDWLPEETLSVVALVVGVLYLLKLLDRFAGGLQKRLNSEDSDS